MRYAPRHSEQKCQIHLKCQGGLAMSCRYLEMQSVDFSCNWLKSLLCKRFLEHGVLIPKRVKVMSPCKSVHVSTKVRACCHFTLWYLLFTSKGKLWKSNADRLLTYWMHVYCVLNACWLHVECMLNACSLQAECMCNACSMHVQCMLIACWMHVECMLSAYWLCTECMLIACWMHVDCM